MVGVRSISLVFAVAALAYSAPALADPPGTTPAATSQSAAAPAETSADLDAIVCKEGSPPTGSRMGATRTCRTQRQWDEMERQSQENLQRTQMHTLNTGVKGG
jgi:hypothetical protein